MVEATSGYYIRLANLKDCEDIYQVHVRSIEGVCARNGDYSSKQINLWVGRQSVNWYTDPVSRSKIIVACEQCDKTIVGFGHYELVDEVTMEIKALYVLPDSIGRGVGNLFMKEFHKVADEHDCVKMIVASTKNALLFYKKHGFITEGEMLHCEQGCVSISCTKMYKHLQ